jgi:hypothetical protein
MSAVTPGADALGAEGRAGEVRLNLVRLAALAAFYGYHLVNVSVHRNDATLAGAYHVAVTALVMVWASGAAGLYLYLSRRTGPVVESSTREDRPVTARIHLPGGVPEWLPYAVTAWDALLITTLLMLAGGPQTPLVVLYFLLVAAAPLRLSLRLVYAATLLAVAGYLFVLGHHIFWRIRFDRYYDTETHRVPRTEEAVMLLGLLASGVLAGQVVRQARRLTRSLPAGAEPGAAAEDEARTDGPLVAAGLLLVAVLVGLGLLFSAVAGPETLAGSRAWPVIVIVAAVFVIAVMAALAEVRRTAAGAAPSPAPGRGEGP